MIGTTKTNRTEMADPDKQARDISVVVLHIALAVAEDIETETGKGTGRQSTRIVAEAEARKHGNLHI